MAAPNPAETPPTTKITNYGCRTRRQSTLMAYVLVWEFEVAQNHREEFERAYGPSGQWRDLFASARGYLGSELLRAPTDGRYLTIDRWESKARFDDFMLAQGYAYEGLDVKLQGLTRTERQIGEFDTVEQ